MTEFESRAFDGLNKQSSIQMETFSTGTQEMNSKLVELVANAIVEAHVASHRIDQAQIVLTALSKDYAIVPRDPTEAMLRAAWDAWNTWDAKRDGVRTRATLICKAMIEAWEKEDA